SDYDRGRNGVWNESWYWMIFGHIARFKSNPISHLSSGCESNIFIIDSEKVVGDSPMLQVDSDLESFVEDERPQLPFGGLTSSLYKIASGPPESEGKKDKQSVGDFELSPQDAPKFGRVLLAMLCVAISSTIYSRWRILSVLLAFQATIGL